MKVVPKSAKSTVTSNDSRYSEIVVESSWCSSSFGSAGVTGAAGSSTCSAVSSAMRCQPFRSNRSLCLFQKFQRGLRRPLLGLFFGAAFSAGHPLSADPNFDLKYLLVIGPALAGKPVLGGRLASPLQEFLQRGLAV